MPDLLQRSDEKEWMDGPDVPENLLIRNLRELDWLNRYTGGHRISLSGLKKLELKRDRVYHLIDIGCGSGDILKYMARWADQHAYQLKFSGIDTNPRAIAYLRQNCRDYPHIRGITADAMDYIGKAEKSDIIHCSLFCHHLNDEQLLHFLKSLYTKVSTGIIINDLQRNLAAYHAARWFTMLFGGSALARHDGPLSVRKAFRKKEWIGLLKKAGVRHFSIESRFPFRHLITIKKNG